MDAEARGGDVRPVEQRVQGIPVQRPVKRDVFGKAEPLRLFPVAGKAGPVSRKVEEESTFAAGLFICREAGEQAVVSVPGGKPATARTCVRPSGGSGSRSGQASASIPLSVRIVGTP